MIWIVEELDSGDILGVFRNECDALGFADKLDPPPHLESRITVDGYPVFETLKEGLEDYDK